MFWSFDSNLFKLSFKRNGKFEILVITNKNLNKKA